MADALSHLLKLLERSRLAKVHFAEWVIGTDPSTFFSWLRGDPISRNRQRWILRIRGVALGKVPCDIGPDDVVIVVRRGARGPQWKRAGSRARAAMLQDNEKAPGDNRS